MEPSRNVQLSSLANSARWVPSHYSVCIYVFDHDSPGADRDVLNEARADSNVSHLGDANPSSESGLRADMDMIADRAVMINHRAGIDDDVGADDRAGADRGGSAYHGSRSQSSAR